MNSQENNMELIITDDNLMDLVKKEYYKVIENLEEVIDMFEKSFLGNWEKSYFDWFEKFLWSNNLWLKLWLEKSIQKVILAHKNLKEYNLDKLNMDLPSYIFREYIENVVWLIFSWYDGLRYVKNSFNDIFKNTDCCNVDLFKNYKEIFDKIDIKISKDAKDFIKIQSEYKNYRLAKWLLRRLRQWFYGFWVKNYKMSFLVMLVLILAWISSLITLPKESSPDIDFWIIWINTIYDWASPEDVDNQITDKIEKEIENIDGINKITSNSMLWVSSIVLEFTNETDISKALQDVKDKVDNISLPTDVEDPIVYEISTNNELMFSYLLYWKKSIFTQEYINQKARVIKDKLEGKYWIVGIDIDALMWWDWTVWGWWGTDSSLFKIEVLINKWKLENLWLSIWQISSIIRSFNKNQPLWSYKIWDLKYDYRIQWEFDKIQELEDLPLIYKSNSVVRLKDIAKINRIAKNESIKQMWFLNNTWYVYVWLNFNKKKWWNIFSSAESAKKAIEELMDKEEFSWLQWTYTLDLSDLLIEDYENLASNWMQTLILVFVTLLFFVWLKEAIIASIMLPISFLVTFVVLNWLGLSMNFLTNFSLIITLWIAIDTLIVVIEGASEKMKLWYNPMSAVLLTVNEFKYSLMSWTFTTLAAFLPMMFLPWVMWKFLAYIPITIFATLLAWLFLSLTVLSALFYKMNKPYKYFEKDPHVEDYLLPEQKSLLEYERKWKDPEKPKEKWNKWKITWLIIILISIIYFYFNVFNTIFTFLVGFIIFVVYIYRDEFFYWLENAYSKVLEIFVWTRKWRLIAIYVPIILLIVSFMTIWRTLIDNFSLFPPQDVDSLNVSVSAKTWIDKEYMIKYLDNIETVVSKIPELKNYYISLSSNEIAITVDLLKVKERKNKNMRNAYKISYYLEEQLWYLENEWLKLEVKIPEWWPPSWKVLWVQVVADSNKKFKELIAVSKDFESHLRSVGWTKNVTNSSDDTPGQFVFDFNREKLRSLNLTPSDLMSEIYFAMNWLKSGTLRSELDDEDIILKFEDFDEKISPDQVLNMNINTASWPIKLSSVLSYNYDNSVSTISREDRKITIKVEADVELWAPALKLQEDYVKFAEQYKYPEWISFVKWWENQENADLLIATWVSFVIAIILIFTILVLQFRSYSQPVIILYTVVVWLLWVNIWLYITGNAYSMSFGIWFIALTWIVVNDAILLIETINENIRKWLKLSLALIESWRSRLQPIMVTTLTTCFWLLPIAMQDEFWAGLWYTVVFGLWLSSALTLIVIPALYYENVELKKNGLFFRTRNLIKKLFNKIFKRNVVVD